MSARVLQANDPEALRSALDILRQGGLVAFPTDTVYGVGAMAFDTAAVERIYAAKGRDATKALPILLADQDGLSEVADEITPDARRLAETFWPGPLTIVVRKRDIVPEAVSWGATIGVRVPAHPVTLKLLNASGPLAATSANLSGAPDSMSADEVVAALGDRIDLILDGGRAPGGRPSTVVDCTVSPPSLAREGPVSMDLILAVLGRAGR
jgi:L-threonylcarbamoyladenylate synthase